LAPAAAVPPVLDPDLFERHEGFRETTLAYFTDPQANALMRAFGDLIYTLALEYRGGWPREPEGSFRHLARAGVADLRHLQGFLCSMSKQIEASELTPGEEHIARVCGQLAARVAEIGDTLERELDAVRSAS
jgi:hypothetical protein